RFHLAFFFTTIPRPHSSPLFPYTTLFRSYLTLRISGAASGIKGTYENCASRPPLQRLVDGISQQELSDMFLPVQGLLNLDAMTKDRKSTRLNSSHVAISYAVFCLKKKKII